MKRSAAIAVGLVLLTSPAATQPPPSLEFESAEFLVDLLMPDGTAQHLATSRVPALPDRACYRWVLHVAPAPRLLAVHERLVLPAAAARWGIGEDSPTVVAGNRRSAETDLIVAPGQSLVGNMWCVAEGDPEGAYVIELSVGGRALHRFDFTVGSPPRR